MLFDSKNVLGVSELNVLVTAVGAPPGKNSVRALMKFAGIKLILADASENLHEVLGFPVVKLPFCSDKAAYNKALTELIKTHNIAVILPCIEEEILYFSEHRLELEQRLGVKIPLTDAPKLAQTIDKYQLYLLAKQLNIPLIETLDLNLPTAHDSLMQWPLPFVVKPRFGHGARDVKIIRTAAELKQLALAITLKTDWVAQQYIPGGDGSNYMYSVVLNNGEAVARFQSRSVKTLYEFGGPATAGEPTAEHELSALGLKLEAALPYWHGVANLEFKRSDTDGKFYLMDLNPRVWGYSSLADDAGMPFPFIQLMLSLNRPIKNVQQFLPWILMTRTENGDDISVVKNTAHQVNGHQVALVEARVMTADQPDHMLSAAADLVWCNIAEPFKQNDTLFVPDQALTDIEKAYLSMIILRADNYMFAKQNADAKHRLAMTRQQIFDSYWNS
ncbi:hypothetical protein [Rheinheimera maricola]|uniref:ATP-grasp domain-containing protein n=1 Tax=Rheinheimera maricola TaxID=2793282 RepID=A0ABS7X4Y1_9GAMM|nr:hypothetical protein [Rheinheimera maricola]MBZ9610220.1 hypothetical protein [Rheinheimera maricola]